MSETLNWWVDNSREEITDTLDDTEKWLLWLNLSIIWDRFKNAINKVKEFFGISTDDTQESATQTSTNQHENTWNYTSQTPDYSAVDTSGFSSWEMPFAHIKTPYKWISAYRVDNIRLKPLIWFSQLSLNWTEGPLTTLQVKNVQEKLVQGTAWYNKKNPCNVSPFEWYVWRTSSSKVADWQNHSQYESMEAWLASFMRLMRQPRYRNKSIQWINCSWMQWIYKESEPDSLKALRITRITHACENLNISPFARLNTDNKETMMAFTQQTAIRETGCYFNKDTLEKAYKLAFPNEA